MKKTTTTLATVAAVAIALTGCAASTPGASSSDESPSGTNRPTSSSSSTSEPEEAAAEEDGEDAAPAADDILDFGQTRTYEDGVSLTVSEPEQVRPGPYAYPENLTEASVFEVTIVNGGESALDASFTMATVQSGNTEAEEVYDDGYEGAPETAILPGREATFKVMFATADPSDIVFQMAPSWDHHEAIFTNTN